MRVVRPAGIARARHDTEVRARVQQRLLETATAGSLAVQKVRRGRAALVPDHVGDHAGDTRTKSGAVRYEPFASHDAIIRHPVTEDLLRWVDREEITVLLVTHDLEEAITLSDRVHLLPRGRTHGSTRCTRCRWTGPATWSAPAPSRRSARCSGACGTTSPPCRASARMDDTFRLGAGSHEVGLR